MIFFPKNLSKLLVKFTLVENLQKLPNLGKVFQTTKFLIRKIKTLHAYKFQRFIFGRNLAT
jgi:uncharacterized C2H2 Zn-finger protein